MNPHRILHVVSSLLAFMFMAASTIALPERGTPAPSFTAKDIRGQDVDLDQIMKHSPDMVILFFFTTKGSESIAVRLGAIDKDVR